MNVEVEIQKINAKLDELFYLVKHILMSLSDKGPFSFGFSSGLHPLSNTKNADYPAYDPSEEELLPKLKTLAFELGGQGRTGKGSCIGNLPPEVSQLINKKLEKLLTKRRSQLDRPISMEQFKSNYNPRPPCEMHQPIEHAQWHKRREEEKRNAEKQHREKIAEWGAQQNQGGGYRKKTRKRRTRKYSRKKRTRRKK